MLPFKTTVSFAKQRFMSSSYKQFFKLETSIEAYINTFQDHDSRELNEYKIAGKISCNPAKMKMLTKVLSIPVSFFYM